MTDFYQLSLDYVGVPYLEHGRTKTAGIDCVGLVSCVAKDAGLITDWQDYNLSGDLSFPDNWHQLLTERGFTKLAAPEHGCVCVLEMPNQVRKSHWHLGIYGLVGTETRFTHLYLSANRVVNQPWGAWLRYYRAAYKFPGATSG